MKRSGQVMLVVMGVTSATAAGHYLTTPNECVQQAPAAKPGVLPQQQVTQQPCRNTSGTRTGSRSWWGSSDNSGSSSSEHTKTASNSSTSAPGATRVGFGGTGHGFFSGS
jgi:hypothetical protein